MDTAVLSYIKELSFGPIRPMGNIAFIPLFSGAGTKLDYVPMREALEREYIRITELDSNGSVPELKATNRSPYNVLLMDGEELVGAKQNRVLNTSILVEPKSNVVIPVSCTEAGRWSNVSAHFSHSDVSMSRSIRARKNRSVTAALGASGTHRSNQGEVWEEIGTLHEMAGTSSSTAAMKDVYRKRRKDLEQYSNAVEAEPGQVGIMAFVNGEVVGFDVVSLGSAYEQVHNQLLQSYVMDALVTQDEEKQPDPQAGAAFLAKTLDCVESRHDAVSQGYDYRYTSPEISGSALVCEGEVVHAAFFVNEETRRKQRRGRSRSNGGDSNGEPGGRSWRRFFGG